MRENSRKLCFLFITLLLTLMLVMSYISTESFKHIKHPIIVKIVERLSKIQESPAVEPSYPLASQRRNNECGCYKRKPVVSVAPEKCVKYPGKLWNGLQLPVLVLAGTGNTGSAMSGYASMYAIGRAYNATVRINQEMHKQLKEVFPYITVPAMLNGTEGIMKRLRYPTNYDHSKKERAAAGLMGPYIFSAEGAPVEVQLFHAYSCDIRKEFTFTPQIQEKVSFTESSLNEKLEVINNAGEFIGKGHILLVKEFWLAKDFTGEVVRVGFHIRRGDYFKYVRNRGEKLPNEPYYENAMNFYKERFSNVVFIVASNDRNHINKTFENHTDVIFVPGKVREEDMAILASCDHSIITVGTFGFWTAYLAGGYVVYPAEFHIRNYQIQKSRFEISHMDNFIPVSRNPL